MKVDVYWNLHQRCWSIKHDGVVIEHATQLVLSNVKFIVQPAGQARVRAEGRKNVHAFARGTWEPSGSPCKPCSIAWPTYYNPYSHDTFVVRDTLPPGLVERPVVGAERVLLTTVKGHAEVWSFNPITPKV